MSTLCSLHGTVHDQGDEHTPRLLEKTFARQVILHCSLFDGRKYLEELGWKGHQSRIQEAQVGEPRVQQLQELERRDCFV